KTLSQSGILLTVGETVHLDFSLDVATVAETVTVQGQTPLINVEEGRISYLVDEKRVAELPLNGRNALQLIELQPGSAANPGSAAPPTSSSATTVSTRRAFWPRRRTR